MNVQSGGNRAIPGVDSPVTSACLSLDQAQAQTDKLLNELTETLSSVLGAATDTKEVTTGRAPGQSDLHEQLLNRVDQQHRINDTIRTLIDRNTV